MKKFIALVRRNNEKLSDKHEKEESNNSGEQKAEGKNVFIVLIPCMGN